MAPDIDLSNTWPADDVHSTHVERELAKIKAEQGDGAKRVQHAA
jgi:hypothetical protein